MSLLHVLFVSTVKHGTQLYRQQTATQMRSRAAEVYGYDPYSVRGHAKRLGLSPLPRYQRRPWHWWLLP